MYHSTGVSTGGDQVKGQGVARPTRPIRFSTYNIRNGWNGGLEYALRGISQANMDLGVFQETKLNKRIYTRESSGYTVVATAAPSAHSSGVTLFYHTAEHFSVEEFQAHGENFISLQLASGDRRWYIMGCYLAPGYASTIEDVVVAIGNRPRGGNLLVVGDFKTDLAAPEGREQDEGIAADLEEEGLEDMSGHFLPWHNTWLKDGCTWAMRRGGQEVRSRTDYILGTDSCLFQNVVVWDV